MRNFLKTLSISSIFLCLSLFSGCQKNIPYENMEKKTFTNYFDVFTDSEGNLVLPLNTTIQLTMTDEKKLAEATTLVEAQLPLWHKLADSHHRYLDDQGNELHNVAYINQHPGETIPIEPELASMLSAAIELSQLSDGLFHPLLGSLSALWEPKFAPFPTENTDPDSALIAQITGCLPAAADLNEVLQLDPERRTVRFEPGACENSLQISLGAMAKGYILDQLAAELKPLNTPFLLDAGNSSIIAWSPDDAPYSWKIGVRDPSGQTSLLYAFTLTQGVVSTSADDQNYFLIQDGDQQIRRHHILNPRTGYSENWLRSVTLSASDQAGTLDVLSTVLYNIEDAAQRRVMIGRFEAKTQLAMDYAWCEPADTGLKLTVSEGMDQKRMTSAAIPDFVDYQIQRGEKHEK